MLGPDTKLGESVRNITKLFGDLMGNLLIFGVETLVSVAESAGELTTTFEGWTKSIEEWFKGAEDQEPGGIIKSWKDKLMLGVADLAGWFGGDTFAPVRHAVANLIIEPMRNALGAFMKHVATHGSGSKILDNLFDIDEAAIGLAKGFDKGLAALGGTMDTKMAAPAKKSMADVGKAFGVAEGSTESTRTKAIAQAVNNGWKNGLDPEGMNKVTKQLVESTNSWAEALKKVAEAAKEVGENMGGAGPDGTGAPGATAFGGGGQKITLVVDDEEFSAYIMDTVNANGQSFMGSK